jgi:Tol biopolymer transport system component
MHIPAAGRSVASMKLTRPLIAVAAGLAALPAGAQASWPGVNGRVSLTQRVPAGTERANRDIFAYPLGSDATALRTRLTITTDNEEQSSWSPDGQTIAFKRRDAVWTVRADGTGLRQLTALSTNGENNTQPSWSADGGRIIYRSNHALAPANVADIWVMNADGSGQKPLVVRPGDERYPSFSPDGSKVLFRGDTDTITGNGDEEIYVAASDGSGVTQLTHNAVEDSSPNWSPDGSRIALQVNVDGVNQEIYVMNADGSNPVRLTTNALHDIGPTWSPDGRMIAFTRALTPETPGDVWIMNADGSGQRPLTSTDVIEESPDWQPIPLLRTATGPRMACGDRSLEPGGVASVVAVRVACEHALRLATRWQQGRRTGDYTCTRTPHTFDQVGVECVKHPPRRCRHRADKWIAFVFRDPAPRDDALNRMAAPESEPLEPEVPAADDELPRGEES